MSGLNDDHALTVADLRSWLDGQPADAPVMLTVSHPLGLAVGWLELTESEVCGYGPFVSLHGEPATDDEPEAPVIEG